MGGLPPIFIWSIMEDINEDTKNLYIIRRRLSELKPMGTPLSPSFHYYVGCFHVIFRAPSADKNKSLVQYPELDVTVSEMFNKPDKISLNHEFIIDLEKDSRFVNYKPIKYSKLPYGNSGRNMPIHHVCELVKYLHRLSNLTAFM